MYDIFNEYVATDINLQTLLKLSIFWKNAENLKMLSFNLNDSCFYWTENCEKWWFLYIPQRDLFDWASVLLANWTYKWNLNKYKQIQKFTDLIFNNKNIFIENYKINVFNSLNINFLASEMADNIKKYGFNVPNRNSIWNTNATYKKSAIYINNIDEDSDTVNALKRFFTWKIEKKDNTLYATEKDVKIEIIIWEDYNEVFNF